MPRSRMMGAGLPGSLSYGVAVNGNQGGGTKKQGLASTVNKPVNFINRVIQRRSWGSVKNRNLIVCVNQLGGVGLGKYNSQFAYNADGVGRKGCRFAGRSVTNRMLLSGRRGRY